jgi:lysozyme
MAPRVLFQDHEGPDVLALQKALNRQAEVCFYPPLVEDEELGPKTFRAFQALGWALGFADDVLKGPDIGIVAQQLTLHPDERGPGIARRARARAPRLHERTIAFDGTPTYWGLAKPLLLAREHGWGGQLTSSDRRAGVAEKFGKKSQVALFNCFTKRLSIGRCPPECGGDCANANRPGSSSHEQLSDASGFPGPVGRRLEWWELGIDVSESDQLLSVLAQLGYEARRTYPNSRTEHHHLNFTTDPGPVLPTDGPASKPGHTPTPIAISVAVPAAAALAVTLTGPDVSLNQPDVDWMQVRAAGHTFAIAKATDGLGTPDPKFDRGRWKEMKAAGLVRGAYHFGRPQTGRDPKLEVAEFLARVDEVGGFEPGDLVPVLDLEKFGAAGRLTPKQTLEWTRTWVSELRRRLGRAPIVYTGVFWRETMKNPGDNLGCPLWLAAYVPKSRLAPLIPVAWADEGLTLWQHTDQGSCPGIPGNCDLNRFDGPQARFDALRL